MSRERSVQHWLRPVAVLLLVTVSLGCFHWRTTHQAPAEALNW
jgi:hypothetical protein